MSLLSQPEAVAKVILEAVAEVRAAGGPLTNTTSEITS